MRHRRSAKQRQALKSGGFGQVERLESRAVLSAESAIVLPPPIAPGGATDAPRIFIAPSAPTLPAAPIISPIAATGLRLIVPPQARAGVPTLVTAIATDAAGRAVPSFSGSATVTSSDSAASLPLVPVQFRNGRASFAVTFATAGAQTVTVTTLTDVPMTATASTTVAAAPTVKSFLVSMPRRVAVGTQALVTLVAVDARGRPVPSFSGTATLSSSDSAAKLPSSVKFASGRAVVRVTFGTLGEQTLTAFRVWSGPDGAISGTAKTMVGEVVAQRIRTLPVARP